MRFLLVLFVTFVLLFGCTTQQQTSGGNDDGKNTPPPAQNSPDKKVVEIKMTAKQWSFEPSVIKVKQGDHVKLTIESMDVTHGLSIPDFGVSQNVNAGETVVVEFDADKKGEFPFRCSLFCGSGHTEMTGKLVVE